MVLVVELRHVVGMLEPRGIWGLWCTDLGFG